jgi:hypothetical protein
LLEQEESAFMNRLALAQVATIVHRLRPLQTKTILEIGLGFETLGRRATIVSQHWSAISNSWTSLFLPYTNRYPSRIITYSLWYSSFRPKLPFVFSEIEGTICEGFANVNGGDSKDLAVSKGCGGQSILTTPFETRPLRMLAKFEFREYHRLPRQSSTRQVSVYKSNRP